jgi:hypothetical protein
MNCSRSGTSAADTAPREGEEARAIYAALLAHNTHAERGNGLACRDMGTAAVSDCLTVSSYLCQPLDRNYRDFLAEQIARLEAEERRIADQLAMLREEWERLNGRR